MNSLLETVDLERDRATPCVGTFELSWLLRVQDGLRYMLKGPPTNPCQHRVVPHGYPVDQYAQTLNQESTATAQLPCRDALSVRIELSVSQKLRHLQYEDVGRSSAFGCADHSSRIYISKL